MTTQSLREKARAAASPTLPDDDRPEGTAAEPATVRRASDNNAPEPLEDIEYTGEITDAAQVPVHTAWARVMADVQSIRKDDNRNDVGGRYNFRGVDRVVNAVGPALRRHGVLVVPVRVFDVEYKEARTSKGTVMQECTLKVEWAVLGPKGDALPACLQSTGQANDTGDKATSKAMSVAQRVLFLTALHVPTHDPTVDQGHDRGEVPVPTPGAYRDEILDPRTSPNRLLAIRGELTRHDLGAVLQVNETGDDETLWDMSGRIGRERSRGGGGSSS